MPHAATCSRSSARTGRARALLPLVWSSESGEGYAWGSHCAGRPSASAAIRSLKNRRAPEGARFFFLLDRLLDGLHGLRESLTLSPKLRDLELIQLWIPLREVHQRGVEPFLLVSRLGAYNPTAHDML